MPYCWACATSQPATVQAPARCACTTATLLVFFLLSERSVVTLVAIVTSTSSLPCGPKVLVSCLSAPARSVWPAGVYQQDTPAGELPVKYPASRVATSAHCS